MAEKSTTTPSPSAAALSTLCTLRGALVATSEPTFSEPFMSAAPPMTPSASFVAKIHSVEVQRASAHEIAT
ncbi:hypothetical protein [Pandoraea vervacti]|uniref:hypothetical protein n=1 Tax=Pandoraea vervacti TaxID=656178 RepID=UPI001F3FE087|nr:hypothetical protein [Pandoraea vervacti]